MQQNVWMGVYQWSAGVCRDELRAKHAARQEQDRFQEIEHAVDRDPDKAKREQKKPDKWIQHQDQQRGRPVHNQQNAEKQDFHESVSG